MSQLEASDSGTFSSRNGTTPPWYAIKVRTGSEFQAVSGLEARGYDLFLPAFEERQRYSDRTKKVSKPAFPGYLFCRLDLRTKVMLLGTPSVSYVVSCAGVPLAVPDEEVDRIRKALGVGGKPVMYLTAGQPVRIVSGALKGVEGLLARVDGEERLTVSVHLLQRSVAVCVGPHQVVAL